VAAAEMAAVAFLERWAGTARPQGRKFADRLGRMRGPGET
jgi:hypothetical protein